VDKAKSDRDRVFAGVRVEGVETLQREIFKAQSALVLARQEFAQVVLAARSDVSLQDRDVAEAEVVRGEADVAVAEARYAEAKLGPTSEERALADATVTAAEATRDVIDARAAKMLLRAPAEGIVGILVPEIGEAVVPGEPILDTDTGPRALVRLQPARGRLGRSVRRIESNGPSAGRPRACDGNHLRTAQLGRVRCLARRPCERRSRLEHVLPSP
jgi:hypothetical protein